MNWTKSYRTDARARVIADRHYNRQHIGADGFVPPGRCLVLLSADGTALWVTSYPFAEYVKHEWAGAWVNSLFRNEGSQLSSELIRQAVACTRWYFGEPPPQGMITFVDTTKVREKEVPGWCYHRAKFRHVGYTKGGLYALQLAPARMPKAEPPLGVMRFYD